MINKSKIYILLPLLIFVLFVSGMMNNPKRNRYLIPEKFYGTVFVYYNVEGAKPLLSEDGFRLIVVPDNGIVKTSSEQIGGKFYDEYFLYSGATRVVMSPKKLGSGYTVQRLNELQQVEVFHRFDILKE